MSKLYLTRAFILEFDIVYSQNVAISIFNVIKIKKMMTNWIQSLSRIALNFFLGHENFIFLQKNDSFKAALNLSSYCLRCELINNTYNNVQKDIFNVH